MLWRGADTSDTIIGASTKFTIPAVLMAVLNLHVVPKFKFRVLSCLATLANVCHDVCHACTLHE